ncbi:MAG: FAD-binding oxidoreductase, partial [Thermoanaerobaculia bacterium]|nr:FAD-binding oxidoreductase [Thermoanaerobaculia bacterium]
MTLIPSERTTSLNQEALEGLGEEHAGPLLRPGDQGYDEARHVWNGMIDRKPAVIARATGAADVRTAVRLARDQGLSLSVRGGGHNIAGSAVVDDGLMIDLSLLRGVRMNPDGEAVRVEPGLSWGDVDRETQALGRAVPTGIVSTTGVAGLTLGGGFGWLSRRWGLTCDHLRSVDLVTATGEYLRVDCESHPDLFWALRGGGGNFGIVTSFEFETRPVGPEALGGLVVHSGGDAERVIDLFRRVTEAAPDELTTLLLLRLAPPAPFLPESIHGKPIAAIGACWAGDPDEGDKATRTFREKGDPVADNITAKPFVAHQQMLDAANPHGRRYYWKSEYLGELADGVADTLLRYTRNLPSPHSALLMMHLGGKIRRPDEDTAVPHREAEYIVNIAGSWEDPTEDERQIGWVRDFWSELREHSDYGPYTNFMTDDEGRDRDRVRQAYGPFYDRLAEIKAEWDPENLFRSNQNIRPG